MKYLLRRIRMRIEGKRIWNDKMSEKMRVRIIAEPDKQPKKSATQKFEVSYGKPFDEIIPEDIGPGGELDRGEDAGGEKPPDFEKPR